MSNGFIKYPRSLEDNPLWTGCKPEFQRVFLVIYARSAFCVLKHNIQGNLVEIQPLQLCATIRQIQDWCGPHTTKNHVERGIAYFKKVHFLRQELRHGKSVLTVCYSEICNEHKNESETAFETRLRQDRDIKEEGERNKKKEKKIIKEKILIREWVSLSQDEIDKLFHIHGDSLSNQMLDILDAYNTSRQEHYKSDYGAMKIGSWVHKEAVKRLKPSPSFGSQNQRERRTENADGTYANADYDERF